MQIQEFEILPREAKEELVWKYGSFLATYNEGNELFDAYNLYEFYVVFCYTSNQLQSPEISVSVYPDQLPYLSRIQRLG